MNDNRLHEHHENDADTFGGSSSWSWIAGVFNELIGLSVYWWW